MTHLKQTTVSFGLTLISLYLDIIVVNPVSLPLYTTIHRIKVTQQSSQVCDLWIHHYILRRVCIETGLIMLFTFWHYKMKPSNSSWICLGFRWWDLVWEKCHQQVAQRRGCGLHTSTLIPYLCVTEAWPFLHFPYILIETFWEYCSVHNITRLFLTQLG